MVLRIVPEAPYTEVRLIKPRKKSDCWRWKVLACPYCGKPHWHGAGMDADTVGQYLTHRVAHCHGRDCGQGYNLCVGDPNVKLGEGLICLADVEPTKKMPTRKST